MFDYIIIDESSQADLISSFPALTKAKNLVIVGDSKQLPNIVDNNNQYDEIFKKYNIDERFNYTKNNISVQKEIMLGEIIKVGLMIGKQE